MGSLAIEERLEEGVDCGKVCMLRMILQEKVSGVTLSVQVQLYVHESSPMEYKVARQPRMLAPSW